MKLFWFAVAVFFMIWLVLGLPAAILCFKIILLCLAVAWLYHLVFR